MDMFPVLVVLAVLCVHGITAFECPIYVFSPFTFLDGSSAEGLQNASNVGFSHMAAAMMAEEQFNARNASVIPALADLDDCNVTLHISSTSVFDSEPGTHHAIEKLNDVDPPCAIVGPSSDYVALELSTLAQANQFPIVVARAFNIRLAYDYYNSFTASVFPDLGSTSEALFSFLQYKERTNYITLLYELSDTGNQRREAFEVLMNNLRLDGREIEFHTVGFVNENDPGAEDTTVWDVRLPAAAVEQVKDVGYRTIVIAFDDSLDSFLPIADAVEEFGINNGDYFFVFWDEIGPSRMWNQNANTSKLTKGSAWVFPIGESSINSESPFFQSWRSQGQDLIDRLNEANPIEEGQPGFEYAESDYFEADPDLFSEFVFDAVISVGLGACNSSTGLDDTLSGADHRDSILNLNFEGATGTVTFGDSNTYDQRNTRTSNTATFVAINILEDGEIAISDVSLSHTNLTWQEVTPFYYADGSTNPPLPLKDPAKNNYISRGLRAFGLSLMSATILCSLLSMVWVYVNRNHRVLTSSQTQFLYVICAGAIIQVTAIFTMSFDEGAGWTEDMLDRACMSTPWLVWVGNTVIYSALFTKLWRIHKVLQFTRRRVKIKQLVWPMATLILLTLIILTLWTAISPNHWTRTEVNAVTGDSVGFCASDDMVAFVIPLVALGSIPMVATAYMAWKTRDIDAAFAESWWIFIMILCQLEAIIVAIPIAVILREQTTGGTRYAVFVFLVWVLPTSALSFIFVPKMLAWYRAVYGKGGKANTHPKTEKVRTDNETPTPEQQQIWFGQPPNPEAAATQPVPDENGGVVGTAGADATSESVSVEKHPASYDEESQPRDENNLENEENGDVLRALSFVD
uniref:G-protein coupled receptors family 3 profile domain-containing protein n=1 Tax=Entomoneis paludosa TaxID=265537 RepID=A0A7S2VAW1_9STRA|mmetsp:Transcript_1261/g.2771  ORF Transcript_1261/g.2771 Transcript_1261/m.2771 type:complete len:859 (+) Transcript_1261:136-2712(+)|eukprot:CAMPEP_0172462040 /NCGR_PEP_ID=MMETSP1065-20121228/42536_1 /TAXON_ID=265537 /ORGANISM="Amphiprora paludosa, Strain CCMP125" /LENGTH=858 /DNA_ID=CAMNT_0013217575 /DNA_START=66 /DNA_END=2642 /DNA_ORIENTATION=-